jgi:hypothetical protein
MNGDYFIFDRAAELVDPDVSGVAEMAQAVAQ